MRTANGDPLKVALLGCGNVGSQVARLLLSQGAELRQRIGRELELVGIAVRDATRERPGIPAELITDDTMSLVTRDDLDVVIEVIGGVDDVRPLLHAAVEHGASVVTANKALLAADGQALYEAAEKAGVDLYFEAAVAGAIPIVRPLRESLVGDQITAVMGIVNGTTNYILDRMYSDDMGFDEALEQAKRLGYAEPDPTADIEGMDAAAKASILASLAFHSHVEGSDVYREGITQITQADIVAAKALECTIKLLAVAKLDDDGRISVRVHPTVIPLSHPLASVRDAFNAIFVESREAGQLMFLGPGAGGAPTASAVVGDVVAVSRNRLRGVPGPSMMNYAGRSVRPMGETNSRFYLRARVADRPGVLSAVAGILAKHHVSVRTAQQTPQDEGALLGLTTHLAREDAIQACIEELGHQDYVQGRVTLLRMEGD